jgi:hypothetical protein
MGDQGAGKRHRRNAAQGSRGRPAARTLIGLLLWAAVAAGVLASGAPARAAPDGPPVRLSASFSPERLGTSTTIYFSFTVLSPPDTVPSPVTDMRLALPRGLSIADSELGLQECLPARLALEGVAGCPPNSPIGHGGAVAAVAFGSQIVYEHVAITLFSAPLQDGHPTLLVYAQGARPVIADLVFPGVIMAAGGPFGSLIDTSMPPVPGLPGGPDVAVVQMSTTIGPQGILYRERVRGRTIRFHPKGVALPTRCPRGGFAFTMRLAFQDGTQTSSRTTVPCPGRRQRGAYARRAR